MRNAFNGFVIFIPSYCKIILSKVDKTTIVGVIKLFRNAGYRMCDVY